MHVDCSSELRLIYLHLLKKGVDVPKNGNTRRRKVSTLLDLHTPNLTMCQNIVVLNSKKLNKMQLNRCIQDINYITMEKKLSPRKYDTMHINMHHTTSLVVLKSTVDVLNPGYKIQI